MAVVAAPITEIDRPRLRGQDSHPSSLAQQPATQPSTAGL